MVAEWSAWKALISILQSTNGTWAPFRLTDRLITLKTDGFRHTFFTVECALIQTVWKRNPEIASMKEIAHHQRHHPGRIPSSEHVLNTAWYFPHCGGLWFCNKRVLLLVSCPVCDQTTSLGLTGICAITGVATHLPLMAIKSLVDPLKT